MDKMKCCFTIQLGGLTIAIVDLVFNFAGIFLSAAVLLFQACFQIKCRIPVTEAIAKEIHRQYSPSKVETEKDLAQTIESEFWSLVLFIVLCLNQVIFNSMLIHGIRKNDIEKVKLWLVFKACIVIVGIFMILTQNSVGLGQGVYRQISEILYVFLTLFFMCIIFILYDVMHRNRHRLRARTSRLISNSIPSSSNTT